MRASCASFPRNRSKIYIRVLDIDEDILLKWRLLIEAGRKSGHTFGEPDALIAATALHHGLTVVTRDTREYERANVPVLNPWKGSPPHPPHRLRQPRHQLRGGQRPADPIPLREVAA